MRPLIVACLAVTASGFSPATPATRRRSPAVPRLSAATESIIVDEASVLAERRGDFPLGPDELITLAKGFLESRGGFGADPDLLAESFEFIGPVVGPLSKDAFVNAIGSVDVKAGFPDFQGEFYGFFVDPFDVNRVWYTARGYGTNTGPFPPFAPVPTNKKVVNPPQVCSITFNEKGLATKYTIGYVVDRDVGTTGGLGGLYGIAYAIGRPLPFPEALPWQKSWQYAAFQNLGSLVSNLPKLPGQ